MAEVSVRYLIDDVPAAIAFYTTWLGFTLELDASPAFAAVSRGGVRLLATAAPPSGRSPTAGARSPAAGTASTSK